MFGFLSPIAWRAIAAAALLAALAWAYHQWAERQREIGRDEIRAEWQADKLARAEANRILLMANAKATGALQAAADKERQALNARNRSIDLERDELLKRLRNRPDRPADRDSSVSAVANHGTAGPADAGCTGAGLYRPDSEFLAGAFTDASRLQAALRTCLAARERDHAAVNGPKP